MTSEQSNIPIWPVAWMTLIATLLLGLAMEAVVAPAIIAGLILLYLATGSPRMPRPRAFYTFLLFVPFIFWWRYGMEQITQVYVPIALLYVMAFYVLSLATHHLMAQGNGGSLDHALGCAVLAMGVAGAGPRKLAWVYGPLLLIFAALMLIHLRRQLVVRHRDGIPRRRVTARYVVALIFVGFLATLAELAVVPKIPEASQWMMGKILPKGAQNPSPGFGRNTRLDSVPELWGDPSEREEVMLRVFDAPRLDPYLRGAVYSAYDSTEHGGSWNNPQQIAAPVKPTGSTAGLHIFNTYYPQTTEERVAWVVPNTDVADAYFLPLGTHEIASYAEKVFAEPGQTLRPEGYGAAGGYAFFRPAVEGAGRPTTADTHVPAAILPVLQQIAREALPEDMPDPAKLRRLEAWFRENFEYKIGIDIDTSRSGPMRDPILQFLTEIKRGHCEYFASAGALMLRSVGVPARYVTGFVVQEPGLGGELWIARRKHAHAWVEAYIEGQGWIVVEPTPPEGVPTATAATGAQRWTDWMSSQWDRLTQLALYGGLAGLIGAAWDTLMALPQHVPVWGWLVMAMIGLAWIFRDSIGRWLRPRTPEPVSDRVRLLRQKLATAERSLGRYGLVRRPGVTVGTYLRSVRGAKLPAEVRAQVLPLLDEYARERFRRAD